MKVKLKQLFVCSCGFPALNEGITIGTEYNIHPQFKESLLLICGGCGTPQKISCVLADSRHGADSGFMPEALFGEPEPETGEKKEMLLSELLTETQLCEVERILNDCDDDRMEASNTLRRYLGKFRAELESKGVNSDYLAYVIAYRQWTGGDNGDRSVAFSA